MTAPQWSADTIADKTYRDKWRVSEYLGRADYPIPEPLLEIYSEAALRMHGVELLAEAA